MKVFANGLEGLRKLRGDWRRPETLLIVMALAMPLSFATWQALLNNFAIEEASFTGVEIGILQSLREVPGFLAFTVVFVLLVMREQTFALVALCLLGIGTAITGFFPFAIGLYCTTVLMSTGFHYFETVRQSLALQWVGKDRAPLFLGQMIAVGSFSGLAAFGLIYLAFEIWELGMPWVYFLGGSATVALTLWAWMAFPRFPEKVEQRKRLFLRRRYWLYYAIVFMSGARRQIFVVFAGFLMVEKFGFSVKAMTLMFLANLFLNIIAAPLIGKLIGRWGERRALTCEYIGLIGVFLGYAFVSSPWVAVGLYIVDHLFFAMSIAIKTYFQKIADPADIASSIGVSFTINHIAAVVIPVFFGLLWIISPAAVFLAGAAMAVLSLALARMVPPAPSQDIVSVFTRAPAAAAAD
ncbi:MAG: MFS transporter [Rhodospirillales bacterium]|nr:MFS transporter [Rhodospirillales bacterium]